MKVSIITYNLPFGPECLWIWPQLRVMVNNVKGDHNHGVLWYGYSTDAYFFLAQTCCTNGTVEIGCGKKREGRFEERVQRGRKGK